MSDVTHALAHAKVNLFANSFNSTPIGILSLSQILGDIRTGRYQPHVDRLRRILACEGKRRYDHAKAFLPAATFGGVFAPSRGNANLLQHNGLLHVDMDHLDDVVAIKRALSADPHVVYVFVSPSATGLKAGIHIPIVTDDPGYKHAWLTLKAIHEQRYGVSWDTSGKDCSRLCFVSYDPDIYMNFGAAVFHVPPPTPREPRVPTPPRMPHQRHEPDCQGYAERAIQTATAMIQSAPLGTRHHTRLRAARLLGGYVAGGLLSDERAYGVLAQALVGYTEDLAAALKTVEDGLRYGQAAPISVEDLEAERQAWLEQHVTSHARRTPPPPPPHNPWDGMTALPLRPYLGYRGLQMRKGARHG